MSSPSSASDGEVLQQAVAIEIRRQALHPALPRAAIAQRDGFRQILFEADVRIERHVLAYAIQFDRRVVPAAKRRGRRDPRLRRRGRSAAITSGWSSCASVAWNVRTGTDGNDALDDFQAIGRGTGRRFELKRPTRAISLPTGAVTSQATSRAPPAAMSIRWGGGAGVSAGVVAATTSATIA